MKAMSAPTLVHVLTTLDIAAEVRKFWEKMAVNAMMRNMPVPGPKTPS